MNKLKKKIESIIYRLVRSDAANNFNSCDKCKKRRKNWVDFSFKSNLLIGYDKISDEWLAFTDFNLYAKTWAMNGYMIDIHTLNEDLWKKLKPLCRKCITEFLKSYVEPESKENEAG